MIFSEGQLAAKNPLGDPGSPDTGRSRVTTPNEYRCLAVLAKRSRRSTVSDLSRQLSATMGMTVSWQSMYRRLVHIGLYAHKTIRCIPLTVTRCRQRLTRSREHAMCMC
ncbi:HTH_Tnp_Tc3_2 domain-containing protein [Trichonephila clavipes]|uniref:HTH_Tnp_Tc3_2 domain-containing protein n=1 Tax=Trichonephila clavipes TaxID=2585209 RepID=A0A8X7BGF3_TRICX|nr:HTH_Tnp_Tc3_2 domain-containing protein [Trichonephila clavipes]